MRGNYDEAVDEALQSKNYALALLIASKDGATYQLVAKRFADEVLSAGSPLHTMALMLTNNLEIPPIESLLDPSCDSFWCDESYDNLVSTWKYQLASILSNQAEGWAKIILALGDRLLQLGLYEAAHLCYLMSKCPIGVKPHFTTRVLLVGCDHEIPLHFMLMTPESIESFERTEAFEWARRRGNRRTCLPSFQPFKLRYAELLADFGHEDLAREYVLSIRKITGIGLKKKSPSSAVPSSGNAPVSSYDSKFIEELNVFEDRVCGSTGAERSFKIKDKPTEPRLSALSAFGGLGSVFTREAENKEDEPQDEDTPRGEENEAQETSENEFIELVELNASAPVEQTSGEMKGFGLSPKGTDSKSKRAVLEPSTTEVKLPAMFTPFAAQTPTSKKAYKEASETQTKEKTVDPSFPSASDPPSFGDNVIDRAEELKPKKAREVKPSPLSTPSQASKKVDDKKAAPASEPPSE